MMRLALKEVGEGEGGGREGDGREGDGRKLALGGVGPAWKVRPSHKSGLDFGRSLLEFNLIYSARESVYPGAIIYGFSSSG
jgi:hypothetical protein